jgi:hypothetical protein
MNKKTFRTKTCLVVLVIFIIISSTIYGKITEKFRNFLYSNGKLICGLAHPTSEYIDSYVNSEDILVITSRSIFTDSLQILKIYISEDFETFEVISDDSFVPAFTAIEFLKDLLVDIIKDFIENSEDSDEQNKLARAILKKIDDLDGKQLSYAIILLKWLDYITG